MAKTKFKDAKKVLITTEKEKISKIKLIGFRTEQSMGSIVNEGLDMVIKKYKEFST